MPHKSRGKVLIIEPDEPEAAVLRAYLEADGFSVRVVQDASTALAAIAEDPADLVLVDVFAEGMPGEAFIASLHSSTPWGHSPGIVVVTADDDAESACNCLHGGADDYVVKPLARERLERAMDRVLDRRLLTEETSRLRRDLSLFAAGQRLLETLDGKQLLARGMSAFASFADADAVALQSADSLDARGLDAEQQRRLAATRLALRPDGPVEPRALADGLGDLDHGLLVTVGESHRALLLRRGGRPEFSPTDEQNALFLARHLALGLRNVERFSDAEQRARRDPLTGVLNGRAFVEAAEHALVRAALEERTHALLFCDLDRFKNVNDDHGHLVGSQVLVELATRLLRCVRDVDVIGRYGGDEFLVLLTDVSSEQAVSAAERIRASVEQRPFLLRGGPPVSLTMSVGVALYPAHAGHAGTLLDLADRAMYEGKAKGRNRVCLATREG